MKLVIGLGNIGKEFEMTNHNMGFMVIDAVAKKLGLSFKKNMCSSLVAEGNFQGERVILAKPTTFMNLSGIAVKSLVKKFNVHDPDFIIISDDIDLERGKVRVRKFGSAGTHNGLRNIVEMLKTENFPRLRIGIGKPGEFVDLADYVLGDCHLDSTLQNGLNKGEEAILKFIGGSTLDEIMTLVN